MAVIQESTPKQAENQQKLLIEIIKRYDSYIASSNTKIAVVMSYSMAYIGGIAFKIIELSTKRNHDYAWWLAIAIGAASILVTLCAIYFAYSALTPQTPPGRAPHEQPSIIFFGDVASLVGGRDGYLRKIKEISDTEVVEDLARQAYVLASIISNKMAILNLSISVLAKGQLPLFLFTIVTLCLTTPLS
ncbi:MAG: Pycsar system effector family protein [Vibrionaceae bacterium]